MLREDDDRLLVVACDGSEESQSAIREAIRLFSGRAEADRTAHAVATLARELGADAGAVAIADSDDIATSNAAQADHRGACAVVVGSRGLGQVKARLLGSTLQGVIKRAHQPVLVVRPPAGSD